MINSARVYSCVVALVLAAVSGIAGSGQGFAKSADRIVRPIDENQVVTLAGNVHPMAQSEFDLGPVAGELVLEQMVLELEPSPAQQAELDALVEAQQTPESPLFHRWLTPAEYGARFGASAGDLARVIAWLRGHGFTVNEVTASKRLVIFTGTAGEVADTFHTELHRYNVDGVEHIANAQDPQIPGAFAGVVGGVVSLHDFRRTSEIRSRELLGARPQYSNGSTHYLFPSDWATIYDLNPLYNAGTAGTGASIAIAGRSNINVQDVTSFRSSSRLPVNPPNVIFVSANPGLVSGDQDESTLDVEWSGATAPNATVNFVVGASTSTTDGVDLSAQYIVNHATAQVVSTSYGSCEQYMGSAELSFYNSLWEQAASEGISAFVSSGDSGAAGCDSGSAAVGSRNAVNGLCSSPYSTCVGGTELNEGLNPGQYWATTNAANYESALGYIPEEVWNESALDGGAGLWASTGGASAVYPQPSWQQGIPGASLGNGMRTVPDVAVTAAGHDGYIIVENGSFWVISGTSAASPSLAGVMALVVESQGNTGQGNANPKLYSRLNASNNPFNETLSGNNSVPGVTGFTAGISPYNLATGLGSVDGAELVRGWGAGPVAGGTANFKLTQSASSGTVQVGKTETFTVGVTETGSTKNAVSLSVNAPAGVTATISPASITPGIGATVTLTAGSNAAIGTQNVTVEGSNSSGALALTYGLTVIAAPTLSLTEASSAVTVVQGAAVTDKVTLAGNGTYAGAVALSVSGLPAGVTATWSSNPVTLSSESGTSTLTLTASSTATLGSATVTVTAKGDGLTETKTIALQVLQAPAIKLAVTPGSVTMQSLGTATVTVTGTPLGGFTVAGGAAGSTIAVASGLPKGFNAAWSAPTLNSAGAVVWTLTLTGSATAAAGSASLSLSSSVVSAAGSKVASTATLPISVTLTPPALSISPASSSISIVQGQSGKEVFTISGNGTYTGVVSLAVSGLPTGVTAALSSGAIQLNSETGTSTLTLTTASTAKVGSATITVSASGDGVTATKQFALQVTQAPALELAIPVSTLSMSHTATGSFTVTMTELGGLNVPTALSLSGLPAGVSSSIGKLTATASGTESSTITLAGSSTAKAGTSTITITVTGASNGATYRATQTLSLQLK